MSARQPPVASLPRRRILIVDDHPLTRRGAAQLINQQEDLTVCGEAGNAEQALAVINSLKPHLVLADMALPGRQGLELIKDLKALYPEILVLVLSMHDEKLYAERALHAGARGYLMKSEGGEKLIEAIRQVLAGKIFLSQSLSAELCAALSQGRRRVDESALAVLTDREFEVFESIGQGLTTHEIGAQLHLSGKTVETHRRHIREKLGLRTSPELIKFAVRWAGSRELL